MFAPTLCFATNLVKSKLSVNSGIASQSYSFSEQPFDAIRLDGDFDMVAEVVHQPRTAGVVVVANQSQLSHIRAYVKNHTLCISEEDSWGFHPNEGVKIKITVENLKSIQLNGSSDIHINNIKTDEFEAEINGSGRIILQGSTKKASLGINGSGEIKAKNLVAKNAKVAISGSGLIITNATQKLDIDVSGSGTVEYYGRPLDIEQSVSGSGKIKTMK